MLQIQATFGEINKEKEIIKAFNVQRFIDVHSESDIISIFPLYMARRQ